MLFLGYVSGVGILVVTFGIPVGLLAWFWFLTRIGILPKTYRAGHCRSCGYNLQGLVEPRCPECGEPFPKEEFADLERSADRSGPEPRN